MSRNLILFTLATLAAIVNSFSPTSGLWSFNKQGGSSPPVLRSLQNDDALSEVVTRRNILCGLAYVSAGSMLSAVIPGVSLAAETDGFAEIAARANKISKELESAPTASEMRKTDKTMYDFTLPIEGKAVPLMDIIHQKFDASGKNARVKAVLVVNIKQDDPVARKDIPELISLVTK